MLYKLRLPKVTDVKKTYYASLNSFEKKSTAAT